MRQVAIIILFMLPVPAVTQNWVAVGNGFNNDVRCLFSDTISNTLFAGGNFQASGPVTLNGISALVNQQWNGIDSGTDGCTNFCNPVLDICRYNGEIYAGGMFFGMNNVPLTTGIAKWNGVSWTSVGGTGQFGMITAMSVFNNELYAVGYFDSIGGIAAHSIAKFNGMSWAPVADSIFQGEILACCEVYQGELYVGGTMHIAATGIDCIARFDGTAWNSVPNATFQNGMCGISTMHEFHGGLFVGGYFSLSFGAPGNGVAEWNGNNWLNVGGGLNDSLGYPAVVSSMCIYGNKLIVGGAFSFAGGVAARNIAMWDDTLWCSFGSDFNASILALATNNDTLYIAGGFTYVDNDSISHVAKWIGGLYVDTCGNTTGYFEVLSENTLSVFPNPSSSTTTFQFTSTASRTIIITDQLGREIWRKQTSEATVEFPVQEYANGMYFYSVEDENEQIAQGKLVIQH